jgi:hypothetical protein
MDANCLARIEDLHSQIASIEATWSAHTVSETNSLNANTDEEVYRCEDTKQEQSTIFYAFKEAQKARFNEFAEAETAALTEFVAECDRAWHLILASYCLDHGAHEVLGDEPDHEGEFGCSFFNGAGIGNAGYEKGVPVERYEDVLTFRQDLDIKHINNLDVLISHAVEFTMEGVAEEAAAQQANVDAAQAAIEAAVQAARDDLMYALNHRLHDSTASLDNTMARLEQELIDAEDAAVAGVNDWREQW